MRATTSGEKTLLHTPKRSEGVKVEIVRGGSAVDVTSRVVSGSISVTSDNRVSTCRVEFEDVFPAFDASSSLSPFMSASSFNTPSALLWPNNEVKIYFGVKAYGTTVGSGDLKLVFHGVLGDSIGPSSRPGSRNVEISCRDLAKRLQDVYIKGEFVYGSDEGTPVVAVIQGILNDNFTWDTSSTDYKKLHVQVALDGDLNIDGCPFVVYPVRVGNCTVWEAINKVIGCTASDDIGYELRYRFLPAGDTSTKDNNGSTITVAADGFYLTLISIPQTNSVADDSIDVATDEIEEHRIDIYDDTIRNDIWGVYYDRFTKQHMELHMQDANSIAAYGRRTLVIGQSDVPFIDTHNEMWALMTVCMNALKDVPSSDGFTSQLMYHIEPNDLLDVTNARLSTASGKIGVTSITHNFAVGGGAGTRKETSTQIQGIRNVRPGSRLNYSTMDKETNPDVGTPPPSISKGESSTTYKNLVGGGVSNVILEVTPLPEEQVIGYEFKWAIKGSGEWHTELSNSPSVAIYGLPPGTEIIWTARAKLRGGLR